MKGRFTAISLVFIGMGLLTLLLFTGGGGDSHPKELKPSMDNPKPAGMKGLSLTLKQWSPEVKRWTLPLNKLDGVELGTVVIANPLRELSLQEKLGVDAWLERGGLVVLLKRGDWRIQSKEEDSFYDAYGIEKVGDAPLIGAPFGGSGRILVVPAVLNNAALQKKPEKAVVVIQEIVKQGGPIYFDEYHLVPPSEGSFIKLLGPFFMTKWGWTLLHLSLVFLFALHFFRPPLDEESVQQRRENLSEKWIEGRGLFLQEAQAKEFCQLVIENYNRRSLNGKRSIK